MELEEAVSKGQTRKLGPGKLLGFAGSWARERQDRGLDPADARHSQQHSVGTGSCRDGDITPGTFLDGSWVAALQGAGAGCPRGGASPVPGEERCWGLAPLLGSRPVPGDQSSSSSICTEDFADRFLAGMVRPLLASEEEEPTAGGDPGRDEPLLPTGRSPGVRPHSVQPGRCRLQGRSSPLMRRESLESLGGRISRLSRSGALGVTGGGSRPAPSTHPSLALGDSPHGKDLLGITWHGERKDPAAGCPRRAPGSAAGRSRASAGSPLPGTGYARSRGHPSREALVPLQREPPAPQGQHRGDGARAVDGNGKGGWTRAPCAPHRPPGRCGAGADVSPCPARAARWQPGKQEVVLPCKRSQEGTWDTGAATKGTRSKADRARAGLHTCCWDPMGLERMSWQGQRACERCQEGLEMERRKTMALQGQKLELQERLRELEHRSRSLLRQRQEVLRRLHALLLQEKVDALQQLQEALEQQLLRKERAVGTARLQHCLSRPWEQAGSCPAMGTTSVCPCQHRLHPSSAMGQGPVPAAVSHVLHVLHGLREQIQQHIRELQREPRDAPAEGRRDGVNTRTPVPPLPCP